MRFFTVLFILFIHDRLELGVFEGTTNDVNRVIGGMSFAMCNILNLNVHVLICMLDFFGVTMCQLINHPQ